MGTILSAIRGILIVITMAFFLLMYGLTRLFVPHTKRSGLRLRNLWIRYIAIPILNIKIEIEGQPSHLPALYVSNHRSFVDPVVICKFLDAFVIAKAEIGAYPIINKGAEATGVIYVKREDRESRSVARKAFVDIVKEGYNVLVFPEGTVSVGDKPLPLKVGSFVEAFNEKISVVPISIEFRDKRDVWHISNFVSQYLHQFGKWTTYVKLRFGSELVANSGEELHAECERWMHDQIADMQRDWLTFSHKTME